MFAGKSTYFDANSPGGDDLEEVEVGLPAMSVLATAQQLEWFPVGTQGGE